MHYARDGFELRAKLCGRENAAAAPELAGVGDGPNIAGTRPNPSVRVLNIRAPEGFNDTGRDAQRGKGGEEEPWEALEMKLHAERDARNASVERDAITEEELRDERVSEHVSMFVCVGLHESDEIIRGTSEEMRNRVNASV